MLISIHPLNHNRGGSRKRRKVAMHYKVKSSLHVLLPAVMVFLEELDCPRALTVAILVRAKQWDDVIDLTINAQDYCDIYAFGPAYQATSILRKADFLPANRDTTDVALMNWKEGEAKCAHTNARLLNAAVGRDLMFPMESFRRMRKVIQKVLGKTPPIDLIIDRCKWGPGSTSSVSGKWTGLYEKVTARSAFTSQLGWCAISRFLREHPLLGDDSVDILEGGQLAFVPKDASTDRTIVIEPHTSALLQRGVGRFIGSRLRSRLGIDIARQADLNRFLASKAYDWDLSTIDLRAASDTISKTLVDLLLPPAWAELLNRLRSHSVYLPDGSLVHLEKHSGNGNGYTFELETLIFAAACVASGSTFYTVFGDDIIVERDRADSLISLLTDLGFEPNLKKTFIKGSFFESCGKDYFQGHSCRPFFLKEGGTYTSIFAFLDYLWPYGPRFRKTREALIKALPVELRIDTLPGKGIGIPSWFPQVRNSELSPEEKAAGFSPRTETLCLYCVPETRPPSQDGKCLAADLFLAQGDRLISGLPDSLDYLRVSTARGAGQWYSGWQ